MVSPDQRWGFLVPLDGSPTAARALGWCRSMALRTGARVVLCRVALPPRGELLLAPRFLGHDIDEGLSDTAAYYLEDTAERLRGDGVDVDQELLRVSGLDDMLAKYRRELANRVGDIIADRAAAEDIAMVIMASHGVTANADVHWGSVASRVLAVARKPVLLMPISSMNDQDEGPDLATREALSNAFEKIAAANGVVVGAMNPRFEGAPTPGPSSPP